MSFNNRLENIELGDKSNRMTQIISLTQDMRVKESWRQMEPRNKEYILYRIIPLRSFVAEAIWKIIFNFDSTLIRVAWKKERKLPFPGHLSSFSID